MCKIRVLLLATLLTPMLAAGEFAQMEPAPRVEPLLLTKDWGFKKFKLNASGAICFAGGDFLGRADGLVLLTGGEILKFAASGDKVPGIDDHRFVAFGGEGVSLSGASLPRYLGDFALNSRNHVVFTATFTACKDAANLFDCVLSGGVRNGLFLFADGQISKLSSDGEPTPDGGVFRIFDGRVSINAGGSVLFDAVVETIEGKPERQLFLIAPGGTYRIMAIGDSLRRQDLALGLTDEGIVTVVTADSILRFQDGVTTTLLRSDIAEAAVNSVGGVVFRAGSSPALFLLDGAGKVRALVSDGDRTPAGGRFVFRSSWVNKFGTTFDQYSTLKPQLNDAGDVVFCAPFDFTDPTVHTAGVFLIHDGQITKIVTTGEPVPWDPSLQFWVGGTIGSIADFRINGNGVVVFSTGLEKYEGNSRSAWDSNPPLYVYANGIVTALRVPGKVAPGTDGDRNDTGGSFYDSLVGINDLDQIVFQTKLRPNYREGLFLASGSSNR
jgi:hypothetical protein